MLLARAGMAMPTVLVGLLCYAVLSRRGPLGPLELLYTPTAIILGEVLLALPIVISLSYAAVATLEPAVAETARTLGAGPVRRLLTYLDERRLAVTAAVMTAFGRCVTELGVALMVGGNIKYRTRTLTTATALETSRGELARGVAMSLILVGLALAVMLAGSWLGRDRDREAAA